VSERIRGSYDDALYKSTYTLLLHCWLGHRTCKIVSEMTYNVSSGTINPTIPIQYHELFNRWLSRVPVDSSKSVSESDGVQYVIVKWIQVSAVDVHVTAMFTSVQRGTNKDLAISLPRLTTRRSVTGNYASQYPADGNAMFLGQLLRVDLIRWV